MDSNSVYVRFCGKVTGPYSSAQVQQLVAQRRITAYHEVSGDAVNWQSAADAGLVERPGAGLATPPMVGGMNPPVDATLPTEGAVERSGRSRGKDSKTWQWVLLGLLLLLGFLGAGALILGLVLTIDWEGLPPEGSFEQLAKQKEKALKKLLESKTEKNEYGMKNFRYSVQGRDGKLEFVDWSKVEQDDAIIKSDIPWKATYNWAGGKWNYVASEREVFDEKGIPKGFQPAEDSPNSKEKGVVKVLRREEK